MNLNKRRMKSIISLPFLLAIVLFLIPQKSICQDKHPLDSAQAKLLSVAREIMTAAQTCTLITLDTDGRPAARIMDPFPADNDFTVWFGTNSRSRKAGQIGKDPRVTLLYVSPDKSGYVSIQGHAILINDPAEKTMRWKSEWDQFYPDRDESYLLIKVTPLRLEAVSYPHGITGDPTTWAPPSVLFPQN